MQLEAESKRHVTGLWRVKDELSRQGIEDVHFM